MIDVCIIGSGAGAGGVAYELSRAGYRVVVLEKGGFVQRDAFSKDEIAYCRRDIVTPNPKDEYHTIEEKLYGRWIKTPTYKNGHSFYNGNIVGGATNFMSGYFHRLKPDDFRLLSTYGEIEGANIVDWPITYETLEPYYAQCETLLGISGEASNTHHMEPRSTPDFPYPPTHEQPISQKIDQLGKEQNIGIIKTPRAILTKAFGERDACYYSNFCGSYGCSSGAKSSSREALLMPALKSGNLEIIPSAHVIKLLEENKKVVKALYQAPNKPIQEIKAKLFVISCGAIESARLLLNSKSANFPYGLSNNSFQVGKNLIFSAGGTGSGMFDESTMDHEQLFQRGHFVNRTLMEWYALEGVKGGIIELEYEHANPILRASRMRFEDDKPLWGKRLQEKLYHRFHHTKRLGFEVFNDWLPTDDTFVNVSNDYRDTYGMPVANIRLSAHPRDLEVGAMLAQKAADFLRRLGASDIQSALSPYPSTNLQAGGCRFGNDPKTSVLDPYCRSHEVRNLFISDGSFMPTGGSVPFTWTIYANSLRIGAYITAESSL